MLIGGAESSSRWRYSSCRDSSSSMASEAPAVMCALSPAVLSSPHATTATQMSKAASARR